MATRNLRDAWLSFANQKFACSAFEQRMFTQHKSSDAPDFYLGVDNS